MIHLEPAQAVALAEVLRGLPEDTYEVRVDDQIKAWSRIVGVIALDERYRLIARHYVTRAGAIRTDLIEAA